MKPYIHAVSSVKKFGGKKEDYLKIHDWFDMTKSHMGDNRHRAILHNSFGIFLAEQVFGHVIKNSDGKEISVRDIAEQHVVEDMGCIPSISDYLSLMEYQPWMHRDGLPPSQDRLPKDKKQIDLPSTFEEVIGKKDIDLEVVADGYTPEFPPHVGLHKYDGNMGGMSRSEWPHHLVDGSRLEGIPVITQPRSD